MATIRRAGFGSVFEVENETVGIGTTGTATNTVQVLGETKASQCINNWSFYSYNLSRICR